VADLSRAQVKVAQSFYLTAFAVGKRLGWSAGKSKRAAVALIAAGEQESTLGAATSITRPNADGDAGVLQQRTLPGWYGNLQQVNNPSYAARIFLTGRKVTASDVAAARSNGSRPAGPAGYTIPGLQQIQGWEKLTISAAVQAVQRSAFPDAYARHERLARGLVATFERKLDTTTAEAALTAASAMCGPLSAMSCPPTGSAGENGLMPDTLRVMRCIHQRWPQITAWAGVGPRPSNVDDDHQTGRAIDAMIPGYRSQQGQALGQQIAAWVQANSAKLGVKYIIWRAHIWNVERAGEGWRECGTSQASCYNGPDDTAAHRDHVHVSTYGDTAGGVHNGSVDNGLPPAGHVVAPVSSYVLTAGFGQCGSAWAACHTGQDFAVRAGTRIRAVAAGRVVFVGWGGAYGNLTKIQHADKTQTWYAHQLRQAARRGQIVRAGELIGYVGYTGNVRPAGPAGAHLHLEVRIGGVPVDPLRWLRRKGAL
jgi:murein DD-endopeptidase MepM/ murein hydrolase activator NlpD